MLVNDLKHYHSVLWVYQCPIHKIELMRKGQKRVKKFPTDCIIKPVYVESRSTPSDISLGYATKIFECQNHSSCKK